ncbi:MAG: hypothetical protein AAGD28_31875 [Bacteroidota bacterium]
MKKKLLLLIACLLRIALGIMWTLSGYSWFTGEPEQKLTSALKLALEGQQIFPFYAPFLREVVIPYAGVFSILVALGEFCTGISLLSGTLTKVGVYVAIFLLLNYSLMNGSLFSFFNILFILLHAFIIWGKGARIFSLDNRLKEKWPSAKIF